MEHSLTKEKNKDLEAEILELEKEKFEKEKPEKLEPEKKFVDISKKLEPDKKEKKDKTKYQSRKDFEALLDDISGVIKLVNTKIPEPYKLKEVEINIIEKPITNLCIKYFGDNLDKYKDEFIIAGFLVAYISSRFLFRKRDKSEIEKPEKEIKTVKVKPEKEIKPIKIKSEKENNVKTIN